MKHLIHIVIILIFLLFSYWQINDPDPEKWIPIYLGVSICAALFITRKYFPILPFIGSLACLIGLIYLSPDFIDWLAEGLPTITGSMKAESPHIELVREFLGFFIAGTIYFLYYRLHKKATRQFR